MIALDFSPPTTQASPSSIYPQAGSRPSDGGFELLLAALAGAGGRANGQGGARVQRHSALATLQEAAQATGRNLDDLELSPEAEHTLHQVLVEAGYSPEQARAIIRWAKGADGAIDIKKLFDLLKEIPPELGPVVLVPVEARAQLVQVLKDLGLSDEKVRSFLSRCESDGKFIKITGLGQLLSEAPQRFQEVDTAVLRDLLGQLGLDEQEIELLVGQSADSQGRVNPEGFLRMMQVAVAVRSRPMLGALKKLVAHLKLKGNSPSLAPQQMVELKDQLVKALEELAGLAPGEAETTARGAAAIVEGLEGLEHAKRPTELARAVFTEQELVREGLAGHSRPQPGARRVHPTHRAEVFAEAHSALKAAAARAELSQGVVPPQVVRQVAARVAQMVRTSQPNLRFTLVPPVLGEVEVELGVEQGALKVKLVAETEAARQILHSGAEHLRQHLAAQGIKVQKLEVLLNPETHPQAREHRGEGEGRGQGGRGQGGSAVGTVEEEQQPQLIRVVEGGLISLFA